MAVDPQNLPQDLAACHALIGGLMAELDLRDRKLACLQHQLERLLRWRFGPRRERVSENQLFFEALKNMEAGSSPQPEPEAPAKVPVQR